MLPRSEYRPRHSRSYKRDLNPVILRWIAGFFHSTNYGISLPASTEKNRAFQPRLTTVQWALLFISKAKDKPAAGLVRCRSPPL